MIALFIAAVGVLASGARADDAASLTYNRDIAPIFQHNCQTCHHPGTGTPMSLMSYDEVRPWVKSIRKNVGEKTMPPWYADPQYGHFKNDRRMSQAEQDKVVAWVNQGAAAGDPKDHPAPMTFKDGWLIGEPDVILYLPVEYEVPADVEDEYKYFNVPTNFTEDKWAEAVECRPGNFAVVHHIIATPIGGFAPGLQPSVFDPGSGEARLIKAGTVVNVQMHYHKEKGVTAKDRSMIGIRFAKGPIKKNVRTDGIFNVKFAIPPNDGNFPVDSEYVFERDSHLTGLMPHMHLRGKDMKYTAVYPDGKQEVLLFVPKYDFNWQINYELAQPKAVPKGTKILVNAHFDNSKNNPANPDPSKTVRFGQPTTDEMMIGWFHYTLDEEDVAAGKIIEDEGLAGRRNRFRGRRGQLPAGELQVTPEDLKDSSSGSGAQ